MNVFLTVVLPLFFGFSVEFREARARVRLGVAWRVMIQIAKKRSPILERMTILRFFLLFRVATRSQRNARLLLVLLDFFLSAFFALTAAASSTAIASVAIDAMDADDPSLVSHEGGKTLGERALDAERSRTKSKETSVERRDSADAAARASESAEAAVKVRIMGSTSSIVGGCSETLRQNRMRSEKLSPYGLRPTSVNGTDETVGETFACAFVTRFRILPSTSLFQSVRSMDAAARSAPRSAFPPPAAPFTSKVSRFVR